VQTKILSFSDKGEFPDEKVVSEQINSVDFLLPSKFIKSEGPGD
jgi:hypothetical protein